MSGFMIWTERTFQLTQTASDAQSHPGHYLSPSRGPHQPEAQPGAGSDDDKREVSPHEVVPNRPTEPELHVESGPTTWEEGQVVAIRS